MATWAFLINHARVLVLIAAEPGTRLRDICWHTGLTEKTVSGIVSDLCDAGYLTKHRVGTRNFYELHPNSRCAAPTTATRSADAGLRCSRAAP